MTEPMSKERLMQLRREKFSSRIDPIRMIQMINDAVEEIDRLQAEIERIGNLPYYCEINEAYGYYCEPYDES